MITSDIIVTNDTITFDDIAALKTAKVFSSLACVTAD